MEDGHHTPLPWPELPLRMQRVVVNGLKPLLHPPASPNAYVMGHIRQLSQDERHHLLRVVRVSTPTIGHFLLFLSML